MILKKSNQTLARKIFEVQEEDLRTTFNIYLISTKSELQGLINKYQQLRGLYNGKKLYVWDAGAIDHVYVLGYLEENEPGFQWKTYVGIMIDEDGPYLYRLTNPKYNKMLESLKEKYFS